MASDSMIWGDKCTKVVQYSDGETISYHKDKDMSIKALVLNSSDTVATAVKSLDSGEKINLAAENSEFSVTLRESIPLGHKFAIRDIKRGERVIKYGETIGLATMPIRKGEHVHVHNVEGLRGRGDRP